MKGKQVGYVLIVLIALGVAGLVWRLISSETQQPVLTGVSLLSEEVVDKVVMSDNEKETTIEKVDGEWQVGPYPVVPRTLEEMWATAKLFDGAELISNNPDNHYLMGLSPENTTVVQFYREGEIYEEFYVGDKVYAPVGERVITPWRAQVRLCYLRRKDANEAYSVFCRFPDRFNPDPRFWADPSIVQIPRDEVEAITFSYPDEEFDLRFGNRGWLVVKDGQPAAADVGAVLALLGELEQLVTTEFPHVSKVAELDFNEPDVLIGIGTREGATAKSVLLLLLDAGFGSYYVKDSDKTWVYFLDEEDAPKLLMTSQDLLPTPATSTDSGTSG